MNKPLILVVDDNALNREILTSMLEEDYRLLEAANGEEAITVLNANAERISLVLLDVVMPGIDGMEVLQTMASKGWLKEIPVVMITAETSYSLLSRAYEIGVTDFICRPFNEKVVRHRVTNTISLYAKQRRLSNLVADQIYERARNCSTLVSVLSHIVEFRNGESGLHVLNIRTITELLLKALIKTDSACPIGPADIPTICTASSLHDIGKISIPGEILNKPGRLTAEEFAVMKTHSAKGEEMLDGIPFGKDSDLMRFAREICGSHHERWDGKGYPRGLAGDSIPIAAQVVSIADVYDALTSERVYKAAFSHENALAMIKNGECGTFNPLLLDCLNSVADELPKVLGNSQSADLSLKEHLAENVTDEMSGNSDLAGTTLMLRRHASDHQKNDFFFAVSSDMLFDFTVAPPVLNLSAAAARCFKIPKTIVNPVHSPVVESLGITRQLRGLWRQAIHDDHSRSCFQAKITANIEGENREFIILLNSLRGDGSDHKVTDIYGVIKPAAE